MTQELKGAGISRSTVYDAFSSTRLPSWQVVDALVEVLGTRHPRTAPEEEQPRFYDLWIGAVSEEDEEQDDDLHALAAAGSTAIVSAMATEAWESLRESSRAVLTRRNSDRIWLRVPFELKADAKKHGARWGKHLNSTPRCYPPCSRALDSRRDKTIACHTQEPMASIATRRPRAPQNGMYEAGQRQHEIERHIRKWKNRAAASTTPEGKPAAEAKVRQWQQKKASGAFRLPGSSRPTRSVGRSTEASGWAPRASVSSWAQGLGARGMAYGIKGDATAAEPDSVRDRTPD
ncbi:DUF5710 domain-containing protein [Streptomyces yokosukanensis]|uniref:DUF5710 domain-containing protein n=2 Tax=Streptomyces yokosukanensis TaxID=67386 RepID=UPI00343613A3